MSSAVRQMPHSGDVVLLFSGFKKLNQKFRARSTGVNSMLA